jgi:hypothetical protein
MSFLEGIKIKITNTRKRLRKVRLNRRQITVGDARTNSQRDNEDVEIDDDLIKTIEERVFSRPEFTTELASETGLEPSSEYATGSVTNTSTNTISKPALEEITEPSSNANSEFAPENITEPSSNVLSEPETDGVPDNARGLAEEAVLDPTQNSKTVADEVSEDRS